MMAVAPYGDVSHDTPDLQMKPVLVITEWPPKYCLLRQFVNKCIDRVANKTNIVLEIIRESWHTKTRKQRLILGNTMRQSNVGFYPQLFETIETVPPAVMNKPFMIPNPDFSDLTAFRVFGLGDAEIKSALLSVNANAEEIFFERYMTKVVGAALDDPLLEIAHPANLWSSEYDRHKLDLFSYPDDYIQCIDQQMKGTDLPEVKLSDLSEMMIDPCESDLAKTMKNRKPGDKYKTKLDHYVLDGRVNMRKKQQQSFD